MITGILLAAGASRRFGSNKLLQTLDNNQTVLGTSALKLHQNVEQMFVVIRSDDTASADLLSKLDIKFIVCDQADNGMGASLSCGVQASADASGWVVALADMPFVAPSVYSAIVTSIKSGNLLAAPFYNFKRGHPVGFSSALYPELIALDDDTGAKNIIARHANELDALECDDPGVIRDIDTPADLGIG
ncbi:MAG: nucleotidyltransferase family protein [Gammaproteobacteria bacterium]|nr:nucleotidyltransferase family protein [Gammaproteobacteria bacterium]